ncbi:hypothetical protein EV426DRAFT_644762 [Tirmania nivea]|nr:hypothetical protein EV426DRAFT_644762 [Tirmania nivea]
MPRKKKAVNLPANPPANHSVKRLANPSVNRQVNPLLNPSVNPPVNTSGTLCTNGDVIIVPNNVDPKKWSPTDVQNFLKANRVEYFLDDDDIEVFRKKKVSGRTFMRLNRERLCAHPYNLEDGIADVIGELIKGLTKTQVVTAEVVSESNLPHAIAGMKRRLICDVDEMEADIKPLRQVTTEIAMTEVTSTQYHSFLSYLCLNRITVEFEVLPVDEEIVGFDWSSDKEDAQMEKCLNWLNTHISLPQKENMQFHYVANNTSLLNYTFGEGNSQYLLTGTTAVAVLPARYIRAHNIAGGIQVAIELRGQIDESSCKQAVLQLLAASALSNYPVMVLLTDLREYWHFLWLVMEGIQEISLGLHCGVALMNDILNGGGGERRPYFNRCRMKDIAAANGLRPAATTQKPEQGQKSLQNGLFDLIPKPDTANMEEFFDEMPEDEVKKWKLKYVMDYIKEEASTWRSK